MSCENCELRNLVEMLKADLEKNSSQHEKIYSRLNVLEISQAQTDLEYQNIMSEIKKMSGILEELRSRPARNWQAIVTSAISATVSLCAGVLFGRGI